MRAIVPRKAGYYSYAGTGYANPHAVTSLGGVTYTYDNNGNVTAIGSLDYTWDWRNRLSSAERNGGGITYYGYDHTGQRVFKATGTATTSYPNKYYNLATTTGAATTTKHIFSPDETLLATVVGSGDANASTTYLQPDHLGGTNVAIDEDGEVVQTLDYYPYGSQRIATGSFDEQRKFTGHEHDAESDLTYANARYYQQNVGRWLSLDPAVAAFDGKDAQLLNDPQQLNSYSYARNNPLTLVDRSGEKVYVAVRTAVIEPFKHAYYYISPKPASGFSAVGAFTLGAAPRGPGSLGNLVTKIGFESTNRDFKAGLPSDQEYYREIILKEGQTEDELIRALLSGHHGVKSGIDYEKWGNQPGQYNANSNNYAYTVAERAGILNQFISFISKFNAPGSDRGVPTSDIVRRSIASDTITVTGTNVPRSRYPIDYTASGAPIYSWAPAN